MKCVLLIACFLLSASSSANCKAVTSLKEDAVKSLYSITVENSTLPRPLVKYESHGGPNGAEFDDFELPNYIVGVHSINLTYTDQINSIAVTYVKSGGLLYSAPVHGKPAGSSINITFGPLEHIRKIEGETNGRFVTQLTFMAVAPGNDQRAYGPYGKPGGTRFSIENYVVAFHGRSGDNLDGIGVYGLQALTKTEERGGSGGSSFDDGVLVRFPPIVGIHGINIWNGNIVDAIQVEMITLDGKLVLGAKHGAGRSNNLTKITFEDGEYLTHVNGTFNNQIMLVFQLSFTTKKANGQVVKYGPFGQVTSAYTPFSFSGKILGFHGRSGFQIDRIGVYYVKT